MCIVVQVVVKEPPQGWLGKQPVVRGIGHTASPSMVSFEQRRDQNDPTGVMQVCNRTASTCGGLGFVLTWAEGPL